MIIIMSEGLRTGALGFQVLQQQKRELSVNLSMVSSVNGHIKSYQQLLQHFKDMRSDKIDLPALHASPHLKLKKYKEAVYYGEYIDNHREGKGIMLYHNGQKYQGDWHNDQRHGFGYQTFANGSTYEGDYIENKMQGQGKYRWPGGQTYQGEFYNNLKNGSGMWVDDEGNCYLGEWKQGQATGFGVYTEVNGCRYEGTFVNFVKVGKGTEKFISGDLYQGSYELGRFEGYGEYFWNDGSYYKGNFKGGLRNGHGMWRKGESGDKYEGEFVDNRKQGYGIYTWGCGNIYKGNYKANLRHGKGEMFWIDGNFYKGQWLVDKPNGQGQLFDGYQLVKGIFQDGELAELDSESDQQHRLSQFYTENSKINKRFIDTPIRKITQQQFQPQNRNKRLVLSQVDKDQEVRQIKMVKNKRKVSPLVKDSFVRKKLMQTITFQHQSNKQRQSQQLKLRADSKSASRQKVLHSSFQVHNLHQKKQSATIHKAKARDLTSDNEQKFAFSRELVGPRHRYYSRLE